MLLRLVVDVLPGSGLCQQERTKSRDVPADSLGTNETLDLSSGEVPTDIHVVCTTYVLRAWLRIHVPVVDVVVLSVPRPGRVLLQDRDHTVEPDGESGLHRREQVLLHVIAVFVVADNLVTKEVHRQLIGDRVVLELVHQGDVGGVLNDVLGYAVEEAGRVSRGDVGVGTSLGDDLGCSLLLVLVVVLDPSVHLRLVVLVTSGVLQRALGEARVLHTSLRSHSVLHVPVLERLYVVLAVILYCHGSSLPLSEVNRSRRMSARRTETLSPKMVGMLSQYGEFMRFRYGM